MSDIAKTLTTVVALIVSLLLALPQVEAQQREKPYRIGYLSNRHKVEYREEALRDQLRELGYVEGKNLVVEWRFAKGQRKRLSEFAAELVRNGVDVIVTSGTGATRAAKKATGTIPIVMANVFDPVRSGIVPSFAKPGGNITGFSTLGLGVTGKFLGLLKDCFPKLTRLALLLEKGHPNNPEAVAETRTAAGKIGVQLQVIEVGPEDFESAFRAAKQGGAEAMNIRGTGLMHKNIARIVKLEAETKLPVMYTERRFPDAGGLMSYGMDRADPYRRVASYVDRILKGTNPGDLPVQRPAKYEFVINLKTAKAAGFDLPRAILLRATEVID